MDFKRKCKLIKNRFVNFKRKYDDTFKIRYVDAHRGISVRLGGPESDLKNEIDKSGIANFARDENSPGAPNDVMYLKQAEHLMRKGAYKPAIVYLDTALGINSASKVYLKTISLS